MDRILLLYNPITAFGNMPLIKAIQEYEKDQKRQKETADCKLCDDKGLFRLECPTCNHVEYVVCEHNEELNPSYDH